MMQRVDLGDKCDIPSPVCVPRSVGLVQSKRKRKTSAKKSHTHTHTCTPDCKCPNVTLPPYPSTLAFGCVRPWWWHALLLTSACSPVQAGYYDKLLMAEVRGRTEALAVMIPLIDFGGLRVVLSWGERPYDLDMWAIK
jgi:hypothetical protein